MSAWVGRQGGGRCALWCCVPLISLGLAAGAVGAAEDVGLPDLSVPNLSLPVPRLIRDSQFADPVPPAPAQSPPQSMGSTLVSDGGQGAPAPGRRSPEERVKVVKRPSSARATRAAAVAALPLAKMTDVDRRRVMQIVNGTSIFRELPTMRFEIDPRVYRFFMKHPEMAVGIWRVMKISEFQMRQLRPEGFQCDDNSGTGGLIDVVYRGENEVVALCDGSYKNMFLPAPIKANGALHVQVGFERLADGRTYATHTARIFVSFPSQTVETAARIMSPVSNAIIDQNLREVSLFLYMMSRAMQRQPGWVEYINNRIDGVPVTRKTELMELTVDVYVDANPHLRRTPRRTQERSENTPGHAAPDLRNRTARRDENDAADAIERAEAEPRSDVILLPAPPSRDR